MKPPLKIEIAYPIYRVFRNAGFSPDFSFMYTKIILANLYLKIYLNHGHRHTRDSR